MEGGFGGGEYVGLFLVVGTRRNETLLNSFRAILRRSASRTDPLIFQRPIVREILFTFAPATRCALCFRFMAGLLVQSDRSFDSKPISAASVRRRGSTEFSEGDRKRRLAYTVREIFYSRFSHENRQRERLRSRADRISLCVNFDQDYSSSLFHFHREYRI